MKEECKSHIARASQEWGFFQVVSLRTLKRLSLPGILPPQLAKLPFLQEVDFAYNVFTGSIPEGASMKLALISLLVNRLSGEIPKHLGNFTTLKYLMLEANQFSGAVPPESLEN